MNGRVRKFWDTLSKIAIIEIILILVLIVALGFFGYATEVLKWKGYWIEHFFPAIITVLITSTGVGLLYEILIRRKNLKEAIDIAQYAQSLNSAGICKYETDFTKIDFQEFFNNAREIDLLFVYGGTWTQHNAQYLLEVFKNGDSMVRICVANPNSNYLKCLEENWHEPESGKYSIKDIKRRIVETLDTLKNLHNTAKSEVKEKAATLIIYQSNRDAPYSFYRADRKMIFVPKKRCKDKTFYKHCFIVQESETRNGLFEWVLGVFDKTIEDGGNCEYFRSQS